MTGYFRRLAERATGAFERPAIRPILRVRDEPLEMTPETVAPKQPRPDLSPPTAKSEPDVVEKGRVAKAEAPITPQPGIDPAPADQPVASKRRSTKRPAMIGDREAPLPPAPTADPPPKAPEGLFSDPPAQLVVPERHTVEPDVPFQHPGKEILTPPPVQVSPIAKPIIHEAAKPEPAVPQTAHKPTKTIEPPAVAQEIPVNQPDAPTTQPDPRPVSTPLEPPRRAEPNMPAPAPDVHIGRLEIEVVSEERTRAKKSRGLRRPRAASSSRARRSASGSGLG